MLNAMRRPFFPLFAGIAVLFGSLPGHTDNHAETTEPSEVKPVIRIIKHSDWSSVEPKGVDGHGIRMNLAPSDEVEFRDMALYVEERIAAGDEPVGGGETSAVDRVTVMLRTQGKEERRTLDEGAAFNWEGYHVSVVAIYATKGDLGFGSTVFEIATVESLPEEVSQSDKAGGAEFRLRVPHTIDKLTLHHSATMLTPEDDLGQMLERMQKWGENDRNWFDVPYHYILDLDGTVFAGRDWKYVGDTNTRYNPAGHFLINCYGNYSKMVPNEKQIETIANLMAWAAIEFEIEPLEIFGHKDLAQTGCPGDNLYEYITDGTLKQMVEDIIANGQPEIVYVKPGE